MTNFVKKMAILAILPLIGGFFVFSPVDAANISTGDLIKASTAAVYYYSSDGGRHCFPNDKIYKTWYADFSAVKTITDAELAALPLKGNVTYKPGTKMVKITTDPKVYAIDAGGKLRWVKTEAVAIALYGADWNKKIDDIPDYLFVNYSTGAAIESNTDFDKTNIINQATSIDVDRGQAGTEAPQPTVLTAPVLTAPSSVTPAAAFTLSWNTVAAAASYTLEKSADLAFTSPSVFYSGNTTSISDSITTVYYYRVKSLNSTGVSAWSNVIKIEVGCATLVAPTLSVSADSIQAGGSYQVSWNSISGATGYDLQYATDAGFANAAAVALAHSTDTNVIETFSPAVTTYYYYRARTLNSCGASAWSNAINVKVIKTCAVPASPTLNDPGISGNLNTAFDVTWSAVTEATQYTLQRDTNSSFTGSTAVYTGNATTANQNLSAAATYYYRVKATNSCGDSAWSNTVDMLLVASGPPYDVPSRYPTIQLAVNAATSGSTVTIAAGTYNENLSITKSLTLQGAGMNSTILNGQGLANVIYVQGSGLTVTIKNLAVTNSGQGGGTPGNVGIHINPAGSGTGTFNIENCKIYGNGHGVSLWNGLSATATLKNNLIYSNLYNGIYNSGFKYTNHYNNTIANNGWSGYYDWVGTGSHVFKNNNIVSNGKYGITPHKNSPRTISYNNVWGNTLGSYYEGYSGAPTAFTPNPGTGEISQDPKFIDAAANNYHLQDTSACIDAGDPSSTYSNEPAPNGSRINMGVYGNTSEATKSSSISYGCLWVWPQKIINTTTGIILWSCNYSQPWCNLGYPQCCADAAHTNCVNMN